MELIISPVILTILGISLGLIIYWFESNRSSQYVFLVLVLLLVGVGFRPSLVHKTVLPPDRLFSIVYENSSRAGRLGISEHARSLSHQLKNRFSDEQVILRPLDGRWSRSPQFRDYN